MCGRREANNDSADALCTAVRAAQLHRANVFAKLGVRSTEGVVTLLAGGSAHGSWSIRRSRSSRASASASRLHWRRANTKCVSAWLRAGCSARSDHGRNPSQVRVSPPSPPAASDPGLTLMS